MVVSTIGRQGVSEPEKKNTPAKRDLSNAKDKLEKRDMLLEIAEQRVEMLAEKIKNFELKAWTDPGPHTAGALDSLREQHQELTRDVKDLSADLKEEIRTNEEKINSLQDEMREDRGRQYDLHKHVTTLSTASILGVAALAELFQTSPNLKSAVAGSLGSFLTAIVLALFAMVNDNLEISSVSVRREMNTHGRIIRYAAKAMSVFGDLCSIGALTAFCGGLLIIILFVVRSA